MVVHGTSTVKYPTEERWNIDGPSENLTTIMLGNHVNQRDQPVL